MKTKRAYASELRDEQVAATRARIVEAALAGFAPWATELPFETVAERARVSLRTVYRHFPTRGDLVNAAAAVIIERSGWKPDKLDAENLGAMTAHAFAYYGTLLAGAEPEAPPHGMKALRGQRLDTIERIVSPYTKGMDKDLARGICAIFGGLVRVHFLRGMHEQWGLDGAQAGRAVEWAINTLLDELRRKGETWDRKQSAKGRARRKRT